MQTFVTGVLRRAALYRLLASPLFIQAVKKLEFIVI
jgi:hypothetical protein